MTASDMDHFGGHKVKTISLTIDGVAVEVCEGTTVLEAARLAGVYVPTLCHDDDLEPYGACRLCVVQIEGMRGLPTSCTTAAAQGMVVHTETPAVERSRRVTVELIMANHPEDCLACAQNQNCELQRVARYVGVDEAHFRQLRKRTRVVALDDSNPAYVRDMNKCILCGRCVRACHEVTGIDAIDIAFRGNDATISTFGNMPVLLSRCETCGECVGRCPTGALVYRNNRQPTREVRTTCTYCAVGCQMYLGVRGDEIVQVRGVTEGPSNEGHLCVKGRFGVAGFVHSPSRIKTPLIKRNGVFEEATWDEALDLVASRFKQYSPEEIGVVSSARATNEDNYVMQKFGRAVLGTNNVDHCARL
jgi:predicted molibdopterin-dependent oxidoreductase YjgC